MFNFLKLNLFCTFLLACNLSSLSAQTLFDFESLTLPASGFYQGDPAAPEPTRSLYTVDSLGPSPFGGSGQEFIQRISVEQNGQSIDFSNTFDTSFGGFYSGFAVSNTTDTTTPGLPNQYSAFAGSGAGGSSNYLVSSGAGSTLTASLLIDSIDLVNTTWAALAARDGIDGSTPSIVSGPLPDSDGFFNLIISGNNPSANQQQQTIRLADYQNGANFLLDQWQTFDVSMLEATQLTFSFQGSDVGQFGLNTPAYFAIDNVVISAVPEPSAMLITLCTIGGIILRRRRS